MSSGCTSGFDRSALEYEEKCESGKWDRSEGEHTEQREPGVNPAVDGHRV